MTCKHLTFVDHAGDLSEDLTLENTFPCPYGGCPEYKGARYVVVRRLPQPPASFIATQMFVPLDELAHYESQAIVYAGERMRAWRRVKR